ncbi:unnamed protein product [Trichogramma brassicae]|uniref:Uncharacterized protein n=1 Tax=Trichogramma brassicae TaxID=86971 RepID=A0A6H5ID46_9HYME|nr:unnamed protein product [Trichogramma brassicae]
MSTSQLRSMTFCCGCCSRATAPYPLALPPRRPCAELLFRPYNTVQSPPPPRPDVRRIMHVLCMSSTSTFKGKCSLPVTVTVVAMTMMVPTHRFSLRRYSAATEEISSGKRIKVVINPRVATPASTTTTTTTTNATAAAAAAALQLAIINVEKEKSIIHLICFIWDRGVQLYKAQNSSRSVFAIARRQISHRAEFTSGHITCDFDESCYNSGILIPFRPKHKYFFKSISCIQRGHRRALFIAASLKKREIIPRDLARGTECDYIRAECVLLGSRSNILLPILTHPPTHRLAAAAAAAAEEGKRRNERLRLPPCTCTRWKSCTLGRFPRGSRPGFTRSEHHVTLVTNQVEILYFWTISSRKSTGFYPFRAPRHARRVPGGNLVLLDDFLEEVDRV